MPVKTEKTEDMLTKAMTFGLEISKIKQCDPHGKNLIDCNENDRKNILGHIIQQSYNIARIANVATACQFAYHMIGKVLSDEEKKDLSSYVKKKENSPKQVPSVGLAQHIKDTTWFVAKNALSGKHITEVKNGNRQLSIYRSNVNLNIKNQNFVIVEKDNIFWFCAAILTPAEAKQFKTKTWVAFPIFLKKKDKSSAEQIKKIISEEYKAGTSQIRRDVIHGQPTWNLRLVYSFESNRNKPLDPERFIGIDIGKTVPAVVAFYDGINDPTFSPMFGSGKVIQDYRNKIKNKIRNINRNLCKEDIHLDSFLRKDLKKEKKSLKSKEKNFIRTSLQRVAKKIADYAVQNNAGAWILEDLDIICLKFGQGEDRKNWMARNWSPAILINAIKWNAKKLGANIVAINPRNTSKACAKCGYIDKENRESQSVFVCKACGNEDNADRNASKNIVKIGAKIEEKV